MQRAGDRTSRRLPLGVVVASAVAAVGLSARPTLQTHSASSVTRPFEVTLLVTLVVSGAVVLAGLVGLLMGGAPRRRGRDPDQPRELVRAPSSRLTMAGAVAAALGIVTVVVWAALRVARPLSGGPTAPSPGASGAGSVPETTGTTPASLAGSPTALLWGLVGVALLVLALTAVWRLGGRHAVPEAVPTGDGEQDSAAVRLAVIHDAERALAGSGSPRSLVIDSYVAMEQALAAHGRPRDPVVTPREFVAVAATDYPAAAGSAAELTEVFERARFSGSEIGSDDVASARGALSQLRRALGGA